MKTVFAQRCYLSNVYASYAALGAIAGFMWWAQGPVAALFVAMVGGVALYAYVAAFPSLSRFLGYGSVDDRASVTALRAAAVVRLSTAVGCPFCPIVRRRLKALQTRLGFRLEEIDITLRPDTLLKRGIRAVPVVEVGERVRIGHATSDELTALIAGRSTP
ncbi:MAG TPA: hypothetical protein VFC31_13645 [Candidatus Limnocylindria bacterium]|jgi:glutaredoxin|nr:hypothetical protein [Candidatus Limnocylindria bacterium]